MFFGSRLFRERPWQHELGLEDCPSGRNPAVQRGRHPPQREMPELLLHVREDLPGIGLIPAPIELLGGHAELDDEVAREGFSLGRRPLKLGQGGDVAGAERISSGNRSIGDRGRGPNVREAPTEQRARQPKRNPRLT